MNPLPLSLFRRHTLWIVPHTLLSASGPQSEADRVWLSRVPWRVVAVDEAHKFANPASSMTQALAGLRRAATILLTGTPLTTSVSSLFSLLSLLSPGTHDSLEQWMDRFGCLDRQPLSAAGSSGKRGSTTALIGSPSLAEIEADRRARLAAQTELNALLQPAMLLRSQAVISALLPPKHERRVDLRLASPLQDMLYKLIALRDAQAQAAEAAAAEDAANNNSRRSSAAASLLASKGTSSRSTALDSSFCVHSPLLVPQLMPVIERKEGLQLGPLLQSVVRSNKNLQYPADAAIEGLPEADKGQLASILVTSSAKFAWLEEALCSKSPDHNQQQAQSEAAVGAGAGAGGKHGRAAAAASSSSSAAASSSGPGLLAEGHRVLIFSRFTMVLDLLEVLLTHRLGLAYERLDGKVRR